MPPSKRMEKLRAVKVHTRVRTPEDLKPHLYLDSQKRCGLTSAQGAAAIIVCAVLAVAALFFLVH